MFLVLKPQVKRSIVKVEMAAIQQQNSELIEGLRPSFRGADRIAANLKNMAKWCPNYIRYSWSLSYFKH